MNNIRFQSFQVSRKDHEQRNGHKGFVIWLTGLSGSGKSTIANELNKQLFNKNKQYLQIRICTNFSSKNIEVGFFNLFY